MAINNQLPPEILHLGVQDYQTIWKEMKQFTDDRNENCRDQIWMLEHQPVYTQGTSCTDDPSEKGKHIPVVHSDRGGKMTYHGPGQLIVYLLMDIKRLKTGPKSFVCQIEGLIIDVLNKFGIHGERRQKAPGVYVMDKKIAALGLRIRRGYCYHGLSLNVDMDLTPFANIVPCGLEKLEVTDMKNWCSTIQMSHVIQTFESQLSKWFQ